MTKARQKAEAKGRKAEITAAWFLRLKGYTILETRYRSRFGEIDLVAQKGQLMIMVEVKARKTEQEARESVGFKQRSRIERAGQDWLASNGFHDRPVRFDVIAIVPGQLPTHIKDAWRPGF